MEFVPESVIERIGKELEREDFAILAESLQARQPVVLGWLFSPDFEAFTRQKREYLLYLVLIVAESVAEVRPDGLPEVSPEWLTEREEANWEVLAGHTSRVFHERLDAFFEQTEQEDLLAFAEDALSDCEDGWVTPEGREGLFVALKTVIDCWTQA
jgi:hypothetical protein